MAENSPKWKVERPLAVSTSASRLWSHEEAAAYLGLTKQTLHFINHKGKGPKSYKVGRYRRYRQRDIDDWLEQQCSTP